QSDDPSLAADTDFAEGLHHLGYGRLDRAIELFERGLERARTLGDRVREGSGMVLLATAWAYKGHYPRGRAHFQALARIAEAEANARQLTWARAGLAGVCWLDRDLARITRTIEQAREVPEGVGDRPSQFGLLVTEAVPRFPRG